MHVTGRDCTFAYLFGVFLESDRTHYDYKFSGFLNEVPRGPHKSRAQKAKPKVLQMRILNVFVHNAQAKSENASIA